MKAGDESDHVPDYFPEATVIAPRVEGTALNSQFLPWLLDSIDQILEYSRRLVFEQTMNKGDLISLNTARPVHRRHGQKAGGEAAQGSRGRH